MTRHTRLDPKARKKIVEQIGMLDTVTKDTVIALIIPHYSYDHKALYYQDLGRIANSLIRKYKDENNIRTFFTYDDTEGNTSYVNVDKTENRKVLEQVYKKLNKQKIGISKSINKIERRHKQITGQISIDDLNSQGDTK